MTDVMKRQSEHDIDVQAITGENTGGTPVATTGGGGGGMYDVHSGENVPLVSVPGNNIGVGQDLSDGINKKARYVSDGQIPNMQNYMAQGGGGGGMQNAALYSAGGMPGVGGMTLQQQQQQQQQHLQPPLSGLHPNFGSPNATLGGRSFSGTLGMGGLPSPASPYLNEQYAAAALSSPALGNPQSASFMGGQSPLSAQTMFNPSAYGPNHVAMAAAAAAAAGGPAGFLAPPNMALLQPHPQQNATGRTVYVGNLPEEASVDELLSQVKFGPIENVRLLPEKNCAFISFLDGNMAAAFHADASVKKMSLHNQELKIGWGKPSACPTPIMVAVQQNQATRNVYLGQLDEDTTEQSLYDELSKFGPIDQVKIVRDKNIGFVHFLSISTAMKVVSSLPNEPAWTGKRVNYGKDRCAYVPKSQQQNQAHNSQAAAMGMAAAASLGYPTGYNPAAAAAAAVMGGGGVSGGGGGYSNIPSPGAQVNSDDGRSPAAVASVFAPMANSTGLQQMGNRTVYLGNIHPDTTTEEICNHIRGGILQNIRFIPEKHIAFITFIESNAALAFYHLASYSGIMIHQRRLKIGWGKHSGPLSPAIAMAVQAGGSRNVYIGNIEDFELHTVDKLRSDFGEYGETELVNTFKEKNCAFVNFCNIQNAIKAIEAMKNHQDYPNQRIGAGKDRCGNPPRAVANTMNIGRSGSHSPNPALHTSMDEGLSPPSMETDQSTTDFTALTPPGRSGDHTGDTSVGTIPVVSEDV